MASFDETTTTTAQLGELALNDAGNNTAPPVIEYADYTDESLLPDIQVLVSRDLSEPYSVFTYRYFLQQWPKLCICAYAPSKETGAREMIGTIICKAGQERDCMQGYIAMLTVNKEYRKLGIGRKLATLGIDRMVELGCDEIMLETEASNLGALALYEKLGFARDEKMTKYYLNGGDAYRLKLWIVKESDAEAAELSEAKDASEPAVTV